MQSIDVCPRHHGLLFWSYHCYRLILIIVYHSRSLSSALLISFTALISLLICFLLRNKQWMQISIKLSLFPALSASLSVSGECESCRGKSYWSWPRPSQPANKSLTSREEPNENVRLKKSVCGRERLIGRGLLKHLAVWRTAPAPGPAWIWIHWETFNGLS